MNEPMTKQATDTFIRRVQTMTAVELLTLVVNNTHYLLDSKYKAIGQAITLRAKQIRYRGH